MAAWTSSGTSLVVARIIRRGGAGRRLAEVHVVDVEAGLAELAGDRGDHAGDVVVADDEHVVRRGEVDRVVVDHHDAGLGPQADERAADGVVAAPDR